MRRSDREVTELAEILSILDKCDVMRLGLCADNQPYIVPMNFGYEAVDGKISIYFHCANEGRKLDMIAQNDNVCFEADCSYKLLPVDVACGWSAEFQSVIGEGKIAVLTDEAEKISGLNVLMKHNGFNGTPEYSSKALSMVTVLRVSVTAISGKRKMSS